MFVDVLTTIASTVFVLGVLIFIHELGHFLVAKKAGIKVEKFSLGFPPNIFEKQYGETSYCIGIIPLGGYVKMAGENPDEEATGDPREFMSKSVGARAAVIFAGPFMNYVLAVLLIFLFSFFYGEPVADNSYRKIAEVMPDSPAEQAGLLAGDRIIAYNDNPYNQIDSLIPTIHSMVNEDVSLTWVRGDDTLTKSIRTYEGEVLNFEGQPDTVGLIGIKTEIDILSYKPYGFLESVTRSFDQTHFYVWTTIKFVKKLVTREVSAKMVGGPLFIAQQSGEVAKRGMAYLLLFMALLSVNLAVLNVLPIPVLDGGHLVFLLIEKIKGSPVSVRGRMIAQQIGLVLLLGLIIVVTYNDILRFFKLS